ncbi:MAG: hypothetical protein K0U78_14420 [Actinomycetia bacterium]|nr:hypothetical protein [Actinomycetes bacterium]
MPPTGSRQDSRARAERAFQLHACGRTWAEVSQELGYKSRGAAQLAVKRLHDRTPPESSDAARRSAAESLRITSSVLFGRFADAARRQDDAALAMLNRELVRNRDQSSKLLGLYAPEQVDVTVTQSATEIIESTRQQLLSLVSDTNVIEGEVIA